MADELSARLILSAVKNSASVKVDITDFSDISGNILYHGTQSIATSSTAIEIGAVSTDGTIVIINRNATNYIEVSLDSSFGASNVFALIRPGRWALVPVKTRTLFLRANTAACLAEIIALDL